MTVVPSLLLLLLPGLAAAMTVPLPGVPQELARERAARLSDVRYALEFSLPESSAAAVTGHETLSFELKDAAEPLALDFKGASVSELSVNGRKADVDWREEHLIIQPSRIHKGRNEIRLGFGSSSSPLNRSPDFLYTLLVPARAREVFPCFDQPDLKARFALTLALPSEWQATANGAQVAREEKGRRAVVRFGETPPMSTYLFAFAAGRFKIETASRDGRAARIFHRELDAAKAARNIPQAFGMAFDALAWMERYTGIADPWGKLDLVLIPGFQYGGMEHPGAIFLNAKTVLLDEGPTESELLGRANLIYHEVAHLWFGDLVTMKWFDDVWLKEVFANFMASKAVEPAFPGIDHGLRFLMQNQASAYAVDATEGTNPIQQPLDNLSHAGSLYGAIIYNKAPVVMRQLETKLGEDAFREGLRDYLSKFRFGNATWDDLIASLEGRSGRPLKNFSEEWVQSSGRPTVSADLRISDGRIASLLLRQSDPLGRGLVWDQQLRPALFYSTGTRSFAVRLDSATSELADVRGLPVPDFVLADIGGLGYASFPLDDRSRAALRAGVSRLPEPLARGEAWLSLWEELLAGRLSGAQYLDAVQAALPAETMELNTQRMLDTAGRAFWRFLPEAERRRRAGGLEELLWSLAQKAPSKSLKRAFLRAYWNVALTDAGVARLRALWEGTLAVPGVTLSDDDRTTLALELSVRGVPDSAGIVAEQRRRLTDPDRRAELDFVAPAVSTDSERRDAFFASLADPANRRHEDWTQKALSYLYHPLRAESSFKHLRVSLEMLEDVARTGDIFFPRSWAGIPLAGYSSEAAAKTARDFLKARPDYPLRLKRLILQPLYTLEAAARQSSRPTRN